MTALPRWMQPMLATLVEPAPLPDGWSYEPKLDGIRCLAFAGGGKVRLYSRNRKPLEGTYPEIARALGRAVRGAAVLDGEVVAIDPVRGISSFSLLQRRDGAALELWLFDCLFHDGEDLRRKPLAERRRALRALVRPAGPIRITPVLEGRFEALFRSACRKGTEGLIGKRTDAPYRAGRSPDWVKLKCVNTEEFVIGGWTDPRGSREVLGALLVGYYDGAGKLRFAGKVGSGYDRETLGRLAPALARRARRTSPFAPESSPREKAAHWVSPTLVAQVGFAEWTHGDRLRHPRFLGLRTDKPAKQVRRPG